MSRRWTALILVGLTLLAAALRLVHLDSAPPGLFLDEAGNGLDALEVLGGRLLLFFERSLGKEPLLNYLIVPFVAWLGREPLAVRLPAALAGVLAVPAAFFLARELLWEEGEDKATWAGLFAAGLLAASYWAITLSRISFRANTLPLLAAAAFALAWWTLRVGGKGKAALAGGLLGLCFYTYLAGRFVYPLALTALGLLALTRPGRAQLSQRRGELVIMAVVAAVVMAPLLAYFAGHPEDFLRRAGQVAFTNPLLDQSLTPAARLRQSLVGNLGMFGGVGDLEPRHNLPGRSLLTPWLAALFWLGVALALVQGRRPQRWFAVAWFGFFLLPAILAATPPRHALRAIGAQPIVYFLCALAIVEIAGWLAKRWRLRRSGPAGAAWAPPALLGLALVGLVALETAGAATTYFGRWARDPITYYAYLGQDRAIADEINRAAADVCYIVPLNDRWRALGGKYTLDFLVPQRERVLFFFPQDLGAADRLAAFIGQPGVREVRLVRMVEGDDVSADPQETATLLLGQRAQRTTIYDGQGYYVEVFALAAAGPAPLSLPQPDRPVQARFSDAAGRRLLLTGWGVATSQAAPPAHVTAGGLGAVALRWRAEDPPSQQLRASLRLEDALRQPVGQADSPLVDSRPRYNPDWQPGDDAVTYHQITAAPGTPPGVYTLRVSVYDAESQARLPAAGADGLPREWVELGPVQVAPPLPGAPAYAPAQALAQPVALASGLSLLGHDALPASVLPGLPVNLALAWEATSPVAEQSLAVLLDERLVGRLALGPLPPGRWRTTHQVLLPADLAPGASQLALRSEPPAGPSAAVELGVVAVEEPPRPQQALQAGFANGAALVGWRADPHPDGVAVTLFWQTEGPLDQELTVFLHVVDAAGHLLAQHDAAPDGGRLPTTLWPAGALIPDRHVVAVPALTGDLRLRAGLYLSGSGVRIPRTDGGDYVEWPATGGSP